MTHKFDYGVFIGRFQPFHQGHQEIILKALLEVEKLIIFVGSSDGPRTERNPLTYDQRVEIMSAGIPTWMPRIHFIPAYDHEDDSQWVNQIRSGVKQYIQRQGWTDKPPQIALCGMKKDHSSYYLNLFPEWGSVDISVIADMPDERVDQSNICSTDIREALYMAINSDENLYGPWWQNYLIETGLYMPQKSCEKFQSYIDNNTEMFTHFAKTWADKKVYQQKYGKGPFVTVDNVVIKKDITGSKCILLIQRKDNGKLALPGGFVDAGERLDVAAHRELCEETELKLNLAQYRSMLDQVIVIDSPDRDPRAHIITHVHRVTLDDNVEWVVSGSDDAVFAAWYRLDAIAEFSKNAEDYHAGHLSIIKLLVKEAN